MLKTVFGGLDRIGALMLERQTRSTGPAPRSPRLRPVPSCEFDYEYYGSLGAVRRGL